MGKTLNELFQTKIVTGPDAKTGPASVVYDVHNSKANKNSSQSGLINLVGFPAQQLLRNAVSSRTSETKLEEELSGLQPLTMVSTPFLYGTDIVRLKTKTTPEKDDMVAGVTTSGGKSGLIGGLIKGAASAVSSFLGMPVDIIPSRLVLKGAEGYPYDFQTAPAYDYFNFLAAVKNDAAGSVVGKFLSKNGVSGTPSQMMSGAIGGAINTATSAVGTLLMGKPKTIILPSPTITTGVAYVGHVKLVSNSTDAIGRLDSGGGSQFQSLQPYPNYISSKDKHLKYALSDGALANYTETVNPISDVTERNDLSTLMMNIIAVGEPLPNQIEPTRILKARRYSSTLLPDDRGAESDASYSKWFKDKSRNKSNMLENHQYTSTIMGKQLEQFDPKKGDLYWDDFADLIFKSAFSGISLQFKATITNYSETFSPSWDSSQFVGSPFKYYTYDSIERTVSFDFKVFARNESEHMNNWDRIKALSHMVYPQGYSKAYSIQPPILQLTLGGMFVEQYGFIETLSYSADDNTPWEIGLPYSEAETYTGDIDPYNSDLLNYIAPKIINVSITFKFLQSAATAGNLYGFPKRKAPVKAAVSAMPAVSPNSLPSAGVGPAPTGTVTTGRVGTFAQSSELMRPGNMTAASSTKPSKPGLANMDRTVTVTTVQTGLPVQKSIPAPKVSTN